MALFETYFEKLENRKVVLERQLAHKIDDSKAEKMSFLNKLFRKMVEFLGAIPLNLKGDMWESEDLIEKKIDWKRPPKEGDGAWSMRIEMIDPDGEKFNRIFQSIPTTRKLTKKEKPSVIIDLEHFYGS
uniref:Uncharacterized protein n=1 Tax=Tanacetum cinerariifolium TaxID=118510 RepID=A0A6L2NLU9_TANCI|nr:hypothetical protein [Tanacetum cinerariifolium]